MTRVYLAGPDVFMDNPEERGEELRRICAEHGLEGVFPFDAEIAADEGMPGPAKGRAIFEACLRDLRRCHGIIANIRPFRGPSADVGTAWEMGYAYGLGIPIIAYTEDGRPYPERVEAGRRAGGQAGFLDPRTVESLGLSDNLMLDRSAIEVVPSFREAAERMGRLLAGERAARGGAVQGPERSASPCPPPSRRSRQPRFRKRREGARRRGTRTSGSSTWTRRRVRSCSGRGRWRPRSNG